MTDRPDWTDGDIDRALAMLHADVETSTRATVRARTALLSVIDTAGHVDLPRPGAASTPRPERRRFAAPATWLAAAAAVAVLVGGALVGPAGTPAGATAQAVELLTRSADVIEVRADDPVGPGQYRFVRTHAWRHVEAHAVDDSVHLYLIETVETLWVPADLDDEWQQTWVQTGNVRWLTDERAARAAGIAPEDTLRPETLRAPRGDWFDTPPQQDAPWPATPEFIASLPRDPDALDARIREATEWYSESNRNGAADLLAFPVDLLRTGLVPADLRAALYEVMARIPGLRVTDDQADLDGRAGVALGMTGRDGLTQEAIIDPATGDFLGERFTSPDGSPHGSTAVTVGVSDEIGVAPAG